MATNTLTGQDSLVLDFIPMVDMPDGDTVTIVAENNIADTIVGKNKNMIIAKNESGHLALMTLRLLKGSSNDRWLYSRYKTYELDSAAFVLLTGTFTKRLGDGAGNIVNDVYKISGGHFRGKPIETRENVNGDQQQAVMTYTIACVTDRAIG